MQKSSVKIGISRKKQNETQDRQRDLTSRLLFVLGAVLICFSLIIPLSRKTPASPNEASVAVISEAVDERKEREILVPNEKPVSAEEDFSIFEYIGEAIASLLTGIK